MFQNINLQRVVCDFPALVNGTDMFNGCSSLKTFSSNLGNLKTGRRMFQGCVQLNEESLNDIAENINNLNELNISLNDPMDWTHDSYDGISVIPLEDRGVIDIDYDTTISEKTIITCGNKLIDKGWKVYFYDNLYTYTNLEIETNYDISVANNYCPIANDWNENVYVPNDLTITSVRDGYGWDDRFDVSEFNGYCPDAWKSTEENWNKDIYVANSLIINEIIDGEMLQDE